MINIDIQPLDNEAKEKALTRQNNLTKPPGSLGKLEELSAQLAGIYRNPLPRITNKVTVVAAGDHGVVDEGVSQYPQDVTGQMVLNFLTGGAAINAISQNSNSDIMVVDAGVKSDLPSHPQLLSMKIDKGTKNFAKQPAMTIEQAEKTVNNGISLANELHKQNTDLVACGEMGIGNTTSASAITAIICDRQPREVTGRGTGIDQESLKLKIDVIEKSILLHNPNPLDGVDILSKVGGFEIGFLAGLMLGCASNNIAVLIDGFICTAAALIANAINPHVNDYMLGSHKSVEPGHIVALEHLGLHPLFDLNLRLGEGTGAALVMPIIQASVKCLTDMATFGEAGVSDSS
tara:strand:- start:442 stop:1482 length:1041 start_codon:yes stop_codon:yes gene_type:complete